MIQMTTSKLDVRYYFTDIVQKELNSVAVEWNHISFQGVLIVALVDDLTQYIFLPHLYDAENYLENVDLAETESIYQDATSSPKDFSDEFKEFSEFQ